MAAAFNACGLSGHGCIRSDVDNGWSCTDLACDTGVSSDRTGVDVCPDVGCAAVHGGLHGGPTASVLTAEHLDWSVGGAVTAVTSYPCIPSENISCHCADSCCAEHGDECEVGTCVPTEWTVLSNNVECTGKLSPATYGVNDLWALVIEVE